MKTDALAIAIAAVPPIPIFSVAPILSVKKSPVSEPNIPVTIHPILPNPLFLGKKLKTKPTIKPTVMIQT